MHALWIKEQNSKCITKCCTRINYSLRSQFTGEHGVKRSNHMRIIQSLKSLVLLPFLAIGVPLALVSRFFENKVERTPEEVEGVLKEMAAGTVSDDMWDDFLSIPIRDARLDKIRERTEVLWAYEEFQAKNEAGYYILNDKGISELHAIISDLHQA